MTFRHMVCMLMVVCCQSVRALSNSMSSRLSCTKATDTLALLGDNTCKMSSCSATVPSRPLEAVLGDTGKTNDVLFCGEITDSPQRDIVFFGGDVQDLSEVMLAHAENRNHVQWSLERSASLMHKAFAPCHVWVIRPSAMLHGTFSIYKNFVESDEHGVPRLWAGQYSWRHLEALLRSARDLISVKSTENLTIIGFSKGCVCLNQLVYDMADERSIDPSAIYWLDGGHGGKLETWVTDESALKLLAASGTNVHVHVTPYQVNDPSRQWIGQQHERFVSILRKLRANVRTHSHFVTEPRSLENHFRVLSKFSSVKIV